MTSLDTDAATILRSLDQADAFVAVFDRHYDAVRRYVGRRVGIPEADEITSETFAVAFRRRSSYDRTHPNARPWLFGIATNLLRRHTRSERRRLSAFARSALPSHGLDPRIAAAGQRGELLAALSSLPRPDAEALLLFALADLSYAEIARALQIPEGTVASRIARARTRMRAALSPGTPLTTNPLEEGT